MLSRAGGQRGFSLVELMVVVTLVAILLTAGVPFVAAAARDSRVRVAAEAISSDLRIAHSEALKRNTTFRFQLVTSLGESCAASPSGPAWVISRNVAAGKCEVTDMAQDPFPMRREILEGTSVSVTATGRGSVCFSGLGRPVASAPNCDAAADAIDIKPAGATCKADGGDARCLRVVVLSTGAVRMCDPAVTASGDPRIC